MNNLSSQRGFSLMELIGVMAVIAILAAAFFPGIVAAALLESAQFLDAGSQHESIELRDRVISVDGL